MFAIFRKRNVISFLVGVNLAYVCLEVGKEYSHFNLYGNVRFEVLNASNRAQIVAYNCDYRRRAAWHFSCLHWAESYLRN
jgi:hypothetical protein